jgi:hypothetical protein
MSYDQKEKERKKEKGQEKRTTIYLKADFIIISPRLEEGRREEKAWI